MSKYIIAIDTICEGIQAVELSVYDGVISYSTEEEAEAELIECFNEMNQQRIADGDEPDDEPEEFVMKLEDYVEGHKTIWTGEQT
mgnify:CR=1 FL=1